MPYIETQHRRWIDEKIDPVAWNVETPGELNYAISRLVQVHLQCNNRRSYQAYNEIMGVLECAKQEFYRTVVAPYEHQKRYENGHVLETPGGGA